MTTARIKLKPCPFCGSMEIFKSKCRYCCMYCESCGAEGPNVEWHIEDPTYNDIVKKWNSRAAIARAEKGQQA